MKPLDNPLSVLPDENSGEADRRWRLEDADPTSISPGERAQAGALIVGSAAASRWLPRLFGVGAKIPHILDSKSPTMATSFRDVERMKDVISGSPPSNPVRVGGLFSINTVNPVKNPAKDAVFLKKIEDIQGTVDSFIDKHKLVEKGVRMDFPTKVFGGKPSYHKFTRRVDLPFVGRDTVLHELGHAADYTTRTGKIRAAVEPTIGAIGKYMVPLALLAGDEIKDAIPGTIDDKAIDFVQRNAVAITGATIAATSLYPEAKASILAVRHVTATEGAAAGKAAMARLAPAFASYIVAAIPTIVGVAVAKKYMAEARKDKGVAMAEAREFLDGLEKNLQGHDKSASVGDWIAKSTRNYVDYLKFLGKQVGQQSQELVTKPGTMKRIWGAAKEVGMAPETALLGASVAVPAAMTSYYLYGTPSGKLIRDSISRDNHDSLFYGKGPAGASESWRERNPGRFAGIVGLGAALSAGVLGKIMMDVRRVL